MGTTAACTFGAAVVIIDRDTIALRYRDAFGELPW
jgi:hypothetical protein